MSFGIGLPDLPLNFFFIFDVGKSSRIHRLAKAILFVFFNNKKQTYGGFQCLQFLRHSKKKSTEKKFQTNFSKLAWLTFKQPSNTHLSDIIFQYYVKLLLKLKLDCERGLGPMHQSFKFCQRILKKRMCFIYQSKA